MTTQSTQRYYSSDYEQRKTFGVAAQVSGERYRSNRLAPLGVWGIKETTKTTVKPQSITPGQYTKNRGQLSAARYQRAATRWPNANESRFIQRMPVGGNIPTIVGTMSEMATSSNQMFAYPTSQELGVTGPPRPGLMNVSATRSNQGLPTPSSRAANPMPPNAVAGVSVDTQTNIQTMPISTQTHQDGEGLNDLQTVPDGQPPPLITNEVIRQVQGVQTDLYDMGVPQNDYEQVSKNLLQTVKDLTAKYDAVSKDLQTLLTMDELPRVPQDGGIARDRSASIANLETTRTQLQEDLQFTRQQLGELSNQNSVLGGQLRLATDERNNLGVTVTGLQEQNQILNKVVEELNREADSLRLVGQESEELRAQLRDRRGSSERNRATIQELRGMVAQERLDVENLRSQNEAMLREFHAEVANRIAPYDQALGNTISERDQALQHINDLRQSLGDALAEVELSRSKQQQLPSYQQLEEIDRLQRTLAAVTNDYSESAAILNDLLIGYNELTVSLGTNQSTISAPTAEKNARYQQALDRFEAFLREAYIRAQQTDDREYSVELDDDLNNSVRAGQQLGYLMDYWIALSKTEPPEYNNVFNTSSTQQIEAGPSRLYPTIEADDATQQIEAGPSRLYPAIEADDATQVGGSSSNRLDLQVQREAATQDAVERFSGRLRRRNSNNYRGVQVVLDGSETPLEARARIRRRREAKREAVIQQSFNQRKTARESDRMARRRKG